MNTIVKKLLFAISCPRKHAEYRNRIALCWLSTMALSVLGVPSSVLGVSPPCEPMLPKTYYPDGRLSSYVELVSEQVQAYTVDPPAEMKQIYGGWTQESAKNFHYYTVEERRPCPAYRFPQDYIHHILTTSEKVFWSVSSKDGANTTEASGAALSLKSYIIEKSGLSADLKNEIGYEDSASLSGERSLSHTLDFYITPSQCYVQFWRLQNSRTTATVQQIFTHVYTLRSNFVIYAGGGTRVFAPASDYTQKCVEELNATSIYDGPKTVQEAPEYFCPHPDQAPIEYYEDYGGKTQVPCCQPFCNFSPGHPCCGCEGEQ